MIIVWYPFTFKAQCPVFSSFLGSLPCSGPYCGHREAVDTHSTRSHESAREPVVTRRIKGGGRVGARSTYGVLRTSRWDNMTLRHSSLMPDASLLCCVVTCRIKSVFIAVNHLSRFRTIDHNIGSLSSFVSFFLARSLSRLEWDRFFLWRSPLLQGPTHWSPQDVLQIPEYYVSRYFLEKWTLGCSCETSWRMGFMRYYYSQSWFFSYKNAKEPKCRNF